MSGEWIVFPEGEGPIVQTEDLCALYDECTFCPGHCVSDKGGTVFCTCLCHRAPSGPDPQK